MVVVVNTDTVEALEAAVINDLAFAGDGIVFAARFAGLAGLAAFLATG